jgi:dTDP-4-amino-4,6-dideoxygalactose transaminase
MQKSTKKKVLHIIKKSGITMTPKPETITSSRPEFSTSDRKKMCIELSKILESGYLTQGPWLEQFEHEFAKYTNVKYAIGTNSGTSALEILLRYYNVEGGEILVPTNTFLATANAVIFAGGRPVLTDISPETLSITLADIKKAHTSKTRGVIVVHIAGLICPEIMTIKQYCKENKLFLIEDSAHAAGATIRGLEAGSLGDGGAFSFYPTKPLTTGEGGMVTTNSSSCDEFVRSVRSHGVATGKDKETYEPKLLIRLGHNWRMSEVQALLGCYQLKRLDEMIAKRNRLAEQYYQLLNSIDGLSVLKVDKELRSSFYKFPVKLDSQFNARQIRIEMLRTYQISCGTIYYPPCHLQPFYKEKFGYKKGDFPRAEMALSQTISLPIHTRLSNKEIARICTSLKDCLSKSS